MTFVFTDIEGSTRLLQELGENAYRRALGRHRDLLRGAFARHGGYEVNYEGDEFVVAFQDAHAAVAAAGEAQSVLNGSPVRLRVGLHTGSPIVDPPKYVGLDVHLAARVMSAAHGGQVLLTEATRDALAPGDDLPLVDLGEHRLKDFDDPVALFQLGAGRFPPLRTLSNTNLPRPVSSFVGRSREVPEVLGLVRASRLVTLTGPGGVGKTRLAVEAAAKLTPDFPHGVFWVALAAVRDPARVMPAISQTLGSTEELAKHIGEREILLVLDNFEQVVDAAAELSALLRACPNLHALVTSRELLRIDGEIDYPVPPLAAFDAVELFVARSRQESDDAVQELCRRLDNLPLSVELAAGRTRVLTPQQILDRLSQRLDLLEGGRDAEERQFTLRGTIEWSYDLLAPEERQLFARLAVFAGGCTFEAAEEVAEADLATLQSLLDKSLLERREGGAEPRFAMLETIREYALERLDSSGEAREMRRRELRWLVGLAVAMVPGLRGDEAPALLDRTEEDYDNMRDALEFAADVGEAQLGAELAAALRRFWLLRRPPRESLTLVLPLLKELDGETEARARCLLIVSNSLIGVGEPAEARRYAEEGLALARALRDDELVSWALNELALGSLEQGDSDAALARALENLEHVRGIGNQSRLATALATVGNICAGRGDFARAAELFEEAAAAARSQGNREILTFALSNLGLTCLRIPERDRGVQALEASLRVASELGYAEGAAYSLIGLASATEETARAATLLGAADRLSEDVGLALQSSERELYEQTLERLRPSPGFERAWQDGRRMSLERAVSFALREG